MVKEGKELKPCSAIYLGDIGTSFSIVQAHNENGTVIWDGYIQVIAPRTYDFEVGDKILITKIKSVVLRKWRDGAQRFSVYADIELKKQKPSKRGQRAINKLKDDIPEELL